MTDDRTREVFPPAQEEAPSFTLDDIIGAYESNDRERREQVTAEALADAEHTRPHPGSPYPEARIEEAYRKAEHGGVRSTPIRETETAPIPAAPYVAPMMPYASAEYHQTPAGPESTQTLDQSEERQVRDTVRNMSSDGAYASREEADHGTLIRGIQTDAPEGETVQMPEGAQTQEEKPPAFESFDFSDPQAVDAFADEVSRAIAGEEQTEQGRHRLLDTFSIFGGKPDEAEVRAEYIPEEPEPDLQKEAEKFERNLQSITYRSLAAFVICVVMIVFTFVGEAGKSLPFGIGTSIPLGAGALAILQLIVMMLCIEVSIHGVEDLIHLKPGVESLTTLASVFALIHAMIVMAPGSRAATLPYCAAAAFANFSALRGWLDYRIGMRSALRGASAGDAPFGVISEYTDAEDRAILKKAAGYREGFYRNLASADISEIVFSMLTPFFAVGSVILALVAAIIAGGTGEYFHCLAALLAGSLSFSAMYAYSRPFRRVTRNARTAGGIVAGWGGAAEIFDSDCALITDSDLFPAGTVSLNGYKVFDGIEHAAGVAHTASLIIASGSELAPIFQDLLKTEGLPVEKTEDFDCFEGGGIGATIRGDRVFVGSAAFMNLQGIRIPETVNIKNAVFTVINGRLAAVFAMNYEPMNSVQGALLTILRNKIAVVFGVRDFNLTPAMLQQRYKVPMGNSRYLPVDECYRLTAGVQSNCRTVALLTREGLGAYSEAIMRGRHLKVISELATVLAALGSIIGFVLLFILLVSGSFESAGASNVLIYQLLIHLMVMIVAALPQRPR